MRGRLIFPFRADIRQLDTEATADAKADGKGYDEDFKEPSPVDEDGDGAGPGVSTRKEAPRLLLPAQVEMGTSEKLRQFFQGNDPTSRLVLIFHFRDLERAGLVDAGGNAKLRIGDRLAALYSMRGSCAETPGTAAWTPKDPVYAVEVQPNAFGIGMARNLLFVFFEGRDKALGA